MSVFPQRSGIRRIQALLSTLCMSFVAVTALGADPLPPDATGDLFVSDFLGGQVLHLRSDGSSIGSIQHPDLADPRGITFAPDGSFFVSSEGTDRVLVFDRAGTYLRQFTHVDLQGPTGSALSPNDELYVSAFDGNAVVVFTLDGTYQRTITHPTLIGPNCVAFDAAGHFLVASGPGDIVLEFDTADNHVRDFTGGGLNSPMSIAFDDRGHAFVSGGLSNSIVEFDGARGFVAAYGAPSFNFVQSIAFDDEGRLFVSNFSDANLTVLDANRVPQAVIPLTGAQNGRGVAFDLVDPRVACRKGTVNFRNGWPASIFTINGSSGDRDRHLDVSASSPVTFEIAGFPGAFDGSNIPYVTYAWPRENRDQDIASFPRGAGPVCFPTPVTGGNALTVMNTLGQESLIGVPEVPGTPLGPGVVLQLPGLNAGAVGRVVTLFTIVPDRQAKRGRIGISNAAVITVVP